MRFYGYTPFASVFGVIHRLVSSLHGKYDSYKD